MALREFVTASDMCTPDGVAGPSNAAAGLANTLLGRSAKDQERLRELPGIQGQPGPSVYRPAQAHSVNAIAEAAIQGDLPHIPGMASSSASPFSVDEFLQGAPQAGSRSHQQEHFDAIYQQGLQHGLPPGQWRHQAPPSMYPPVNGNAQVLSPSLQAFMESGRARAAFHPMPLPQMRLSVEDQCRVRDRSTIMARHMYADRGDAFADEQVGKLLRSLNINAEQLPSGGQGPPQSWDAIFRAGAPRYLHEGPAVADVAAGSQMAALHGPENRWASEFAGLSLAEQGQDHAPNTWAAEFNQTAASPRQRWVEDFAAEQGQGWAEEFGRSQAGTTASLGKADQQQDHAATLAQTKALADHLAKDGNPKMKNSQFLQFLSKMSQGEIILEDNQVKEVASAALGAQWANEFATQASTSNQMVEEFLAQPQARHGAAQSSVPDQWADQYGAEGYGASEWADQFANQLAAGTDVDSWMEDFAKEMDEQVAAQRASGVASTSSQEYVFQPNNPFLSDPDSAEKGKQLFRHGLLSEAVLAFEAEVQRHPNNVEAWRMLGTVQAENDDDTQAIAALNRALQADPDNAEVLLSLGVSYTNELDQAQALNYLHRWLSQHPTHSPAASAVPDPGDTSQRLAWVMRSFEEAAATAPADGDLQAALGVLYNLSREYEKAVTAFRTSLQIQPKDYSLWNKLGATLANSSHSADAITAYQRALELKPNYMRAWTNMGISQANVGEYEASARYYTRALALNPSASSVWGYLRTSLACAGRMDLMAAVDNEDLPSLQEALPLMYFGAVDQNKLPPSQGLGRIMKRMWQIMRHSKRVLTLAAICMTLAAMSELAIPHFVSASIFALNKANSAELFKRNLTLLATMAFSYGIFAGLRGYLFSLLNIDLIQRLRGELFGALLKQEISFFDKEEVGALTSRLGADCSSVTRALATNINVAARNSLQAIGGTVYLFYLSRGLASACLGVTAILWAVALRFGAFSRRTARTYQDALAETNQVAEEVFLLSRVVRTFGTEDQEKRRYERCLSILRVIGVRQAAAYLMYLTTNSALFNLTKVVTLLVGGGMALNGIIDGQTLTTFVFYVEFVTAASLSVCDQWGSIMEAIGASERVMYYLDKPVAAQIQGGDCVPSWSGKVEFKDVCFRYPTRPEVVALDSINLSLEPGQLVALVGLSGSGKSTLVALLQRLYDPTGGKVLIDGAPLDEVDAQWYRSQIGVVSQDPRLFSTTVAANITYGCPNRTQEQIEEAAGLANAHEFIVKLPQDYQTLVRDGLLSGGQRQRIALARALVREPKLLILDEATSALDAESEAAVQRGMDSAMKAENRSVLVIAHRLSTVRNADLTIVMADGRIAERGTHAALLTQQGIYAQLVRRQTDGGAPPLAEDTEDDEEEQDFDPASTATGSIIDSQGLLDSQDLRQQNGAAEKLQEFQEANLSTEFTEDPEEPVPGAGAWFGTDPVQYQTGGRQQDGDGLAAAAALAGQQQGGSDGGSQRPNSRRKRDKKDLSKASLDDAAKQLEQSLDDVPEMAGLNKKLQAKDAKHE